MLKDDLRKGIADIMSEEPRMPPGASGLVILGFLAMFWPLGLLVASFDHGALPEPPQFGLGLYAMAVLSVVVGAAILLGTVRRRGWVIPLALLGIGGVAGAVMLVLGFAYRNGNPLISLVFGFLPGLIGIGFYVRSLLSQRCLAWFGIAIVPTSAADRRQLGPADLTVHTPDPPTPGTRLRKRSKQNQHS